jgi:DNA-binding CsgD family transcriptional regulator
VSSSAAARELVAVAARGLDAAALRAAVVGPLRRLTGAGPVFVASADPVTWLLTGGLPADVPADAARALMAREYADSDVITFRGLAGAQVPVANLYDRADSPAHSARWRDVLEPLGWGDELRAAVRDRTGTWGFLCLHRIAGEQPFSPADRAAVAGVLPLLAAAFRRSSVAATALSANASAPGVLLIDGDDQPIGSTGPAAQLVDEIGTTDGLPLPVLSVVRSLRSTGVVTTVRLRSRAGRWLTVHAAFVEGTDQVAVVIEPAHPHDVLPVLAAALELTSREAEVAAALLRGESSRLIARRLCIAEATVNVHLRSVFAKAGVHSRGELIARTLAG